MQSYQALKIRQVISAGAKQFGIWIFLLCYLLVFFLPVLFSEFYADDIVTNGVVLSRTVLENKSLITIMIEWIQDWLRNGRFFPITILLTIPIQYLILNSLVYKTYMIALLILNIMVFSKFVYARTGSKYAAYLSVLLIPLFFQLRYYSDPILSYAGFLQLLLFFLIGSTLYYGYYLDRGKLAHLLVSVFLYAMALMTYEVSFGLVLIIIGLSVLHHRNSIRNIIRTTFVHLVITVIFLVINFLVRSYSNNLLTVGYSGINVNLDARLVVSTFLAQLVSAIPLIYFSNNFTFFLPYVFRQSYTPEFLSLLIFSPFFIYSLNQIMNKLTMKRFPIDLLIISMILWIFPAVVISISSEYQELLVTNATMKALGHMPVYIQYYGVCLIVFSIITGLNSARFIPTLMQKRIFRFLSYLFTIMILVTFLINSAVVNVSNFYLGNHTVMLNQAIKKGFFQTIPDSTVLLVLINNHFEYLPGELQFRYSYWPFQTNWISQPLLYAYTGKLFQTHYTIPELGSNTFATLANQGKVYLLEHTYFPDKSLVQNSHVRISRITNVQGYENNLYLTQLATEPIATHYINQIH